MPLSKAISLQSDIPVIGEFIKEGKGLACALKGAGFDGVAASMVGAGERTGNLAGAVGKALEMLEKRALTRKKVLSSLTYPCIVILVSIAVLSIMTFIFIPNIVNMYGSLGVDPKHSGLLVVDLMRLLPVLILSSIALIAGLIYYILSDKGFDMPFIGTQRRKYVASHLSSFIGMSLAAGVPLKETAEFSEGLFDSGWYKRGMNRALEAIKEGKLFSVALSLTGLFDDNAVSMLRAGECSSSLERVLAALSRIYDEELDDAINLATKLIEPISTLATGAIVGIIVFAMVEPMVKLMDMMGV